MYDFEPLKLLLPIFMERRKVMIKFVFFSLKWLWWYIEVEPILKWSPEPVDKTSRTSTFKKVKMKRVLRSKVHLHIFSNFYFIWILFRVSPSLNINLMEAPSSKDSFSDLFFSFYSFLTDNQTKDWGKKKIGRREKNIIAPWSHM